MNKLTRVLNQIGKRQDMMLAAMLMAAIFMMILPLPTVIIDALISVNLTLAIILLMLAIYIDSPVEFSAFPSILLITTLFRLALTVSTSRLILLQHDAGHIVSAFGNFVVGGNLVVGLIIFLIITIVQFIVITKGGERVAEVSARFSLDGMPGKQMSIDGDLRAGVIDAQEAKYLRGQVQKESQLYGAMDGAMKFVKGDAIASLIVILVNLVGGLCVGIFVHGMDASTALGTYAILSIGSGLLDQIPGLLISITAGMVVTRVPDEDKQNLARTVVGQLISKPMALMAAAVLILIFALIPGFPFFDFLTLSLLIVTIVLFSTQGKKWLNTIRNKEHDDTSAHIDEEPTFTGTHPLAIESTMIDTAMPMSRRKQFRDKLDRWAKDKSQILGFPLPEVKLALRSASDDTNKVVISLYGTPVLEETFAANECLSLQTAAQLEAKKYPL